MTMTDQSRRGDSNPQPPAYKADALPIAPRRPTISRYPTGPARPGSGCSRTDVRVRSSAASVAESLVRGPSPSLGAAGPYAGDRRATFDLWQPM